MAKESVKTTTPPNVPTKNNSSCTTALMALFLKTYFFFKLASDVSGVELVKLEYMKPFRNAYGDRMTEAQEQQLERRLT